MIKTKLDKILYVSWTGDNDITPKRLKCLESMRKSVGVPIVVVTKDNLHEYNMDSDPMHAGYQYLSATQRADYLRCYLMHHHGGGYADIKMWRYDWNVWFDSLIISNHYAAGYPEPRPLDAIPQLRHVWQLLIGNGAFIYKPNTPLTREWLKNENAVMDKHYEALKRNPASFPQDCLKVGTGYPIRWVEVGGEIMHPLAYKYNKKILRIMKFDKQTPDIYR